MPQIELTTHIAAPCSRCFDLARSIELHTLSTSRTGERVIAGKLHGLLTLGDEVTWSARHLGVWQTLTIRITAFDPPKHFRDSMVRGTFKRLDHDHYFTTGAPGWTLMRDVFDYVAPLGPLGWSAERLFLTRYMRHFLQARNQQLKCVAESDEWRRFVAPLT